MDAVQAARTIAPELDRIRMGVARQVQQQVTPRMEELGLSAQGMQIFVLLRNAAGRVVRRDGLRAAVRYMSDDDWYAGTGSIFSADLIARDMGSFELTTTGTAVAEQLSRTSDQICQQLWAGVDDLPALLQLTSQALDGLPHEPGSAFAVVHPPRLIPDISVAGILAENLTGLRFHRADAHAQAWAEAGHTAATVQEMADTPERQEIEDRTDELAAAPYDRLSADARDALIAGLAELPS
jgi:hypothetical protein